jgi:hypothetical protein
METKTQFQVFDTYDDKVNGTYKIGSLEGLYFRDLVRKLGEPTVIGSGDDKVQYEWIMKFEGEIFTIYDWKTYDAEYTEYELDTWSIGGNANSAALLFAFKDYIYEL